MAFRETTMGITTMQQHDADHDLVRRIAEEDPLALERLYQTHGPMLLRYLIGQLGEVQRAEEVLQDVMLAAWQGARRFRGASSVTTWLLAIAHRRAVSARRTWSTTTLPLNEAAPSDDAGPLETTLITMQRDEVQKILRTLPRHQRETLELVFYHGLSGPETADVRARRPS